MARNTLKKLVIFGDPKKGEVSEVVAEFVKFVEGKAEITDNCNIEECTTEVLEESDFAVVFGGDGSIISAARNLSRCNVPVIGVNLGKLGFLAEFSIDELKDHFDDIISGKAVVDWKTNRDIFEFINRKNMRTHYIESPAEKVSLVKKLDFKILSL